MSFSSFWTSTSAGSHQQAFSYNSLRRPIYIFNLVDITKFLFGWRSIFARTCSFRELYCWNSERMVSNSWEETSLLFKALENYLSMVSRLATASAVIFWCFLIFESSFLLAIISPEETRAKQPPTPPKETEASRPTTDRVETKLALENAAERTLTIQLTIFFPSFVFFSDEAIVADLMVQSVGDLVYLLQAEILSWRRQYWIETRQEERKVRHLLKTLYKRNFNLTLIQK